MGRVATDHRRTSRRFRVVRLVLLASIVGLAELFAQEVHAARSHRHLEPGALFRDREVVRQRPRMPLRIPVWQLCASLACFLVVVWLGLLFAPSSAAGAGGDSWWDSRREPATTLAESIYRLPVYVSVLYTAAHPDDENNALLAYLARGVFARTAYLSLTRGDGGQNRIGRELFEALGVIRTEELLAARQVDGAEQFFTRAYDFGFSKSADETLAKWPREAILEDVVRVIRTFRPDIVISRFFGTPLDGHGHHQAAGILTREAFFAAADPSRFPQQIADGLPPWQAAKLFWNEFRSSRGSAPIETAQGVTVDLGAYNPLWAQTYYQLGLGAQNLHRSQLPPRLPRRGERLDGFRRLDVEGGHPDNDLFAGMDLTLTRVADVLRADSRSMPLIRSELQDIQSLAQAAADRFSPRQPSAIVPLLWQGYERLRRLRQALPSRALDAPALDHIDYALGLKEQEFRTALERSLGLEIEAVAAAQSAVRGGTLAVTVSMVNHSLHTIAVESVQLQAPSGWQVQSPVFQKTQLAPHQGSDLTFTVAIPADAALTQPYWLERSRDGDHFRVEHPKHLIQPVDGPLLTASWRWRIDEDSFSGDVDSRREVEFPIAGRGAGVVRQPLRVVPELSVVLEPPVLIAPLTDPPAARQVSVTLLAHVVGDAMLRLQVPDGWSVEPPEHAVAFTAAGQEVTRKFAVQVPAPSVEGSFHIKAVAEIAGKHYAHGYQLVEYPHIRSQPLYREAMTRVEVFTINTAPRLRVGYVMGAGDEVPATIAQLGIEVNLLATEDLAATDLQRYDTIVVGVRAYEFRPDLVAHQSRLLDFVRQGGNLIVQYHTLASEGVAFTPYPAKLSRARVVDEAAVMTILEPGHVLFHWPNVITASDFKGWIQERGLYFLEQWDERFTPLLECHDPGESPQRGGMVIAPYGKGQFIYTGYAWFRQLPAGVPGAIRLFTNLISLPRAP